MEIERLGPYEIVGTLGRGGMGAVYKALHHETHEAAAVKLLSADLAEEEGFRSRFEAEIVSRPPPRRDSTANSPFSECIAPPSPMP